MATIGGYMIFLNLLQILSLLGVGVGGGGGGGGGDGSGGCCAMAVNLVVALTVCCDR